MQFTRSGHTQIRANAIMITSTITVVLFSTLVNLNLDFMHTCSHSKTLVLYAHLFTFEIC